MATLSESVNEIFFGCVRYRQEEAILLNFLRVAINNNICLAGTIEYGIAWGSIPF